MATKPSSWTVVPANSEAPDLWTDCVLYIPFWEGSGNDIEIIYNNSGTFGSVTGAPTGGTPTWSTIASGNLQGAAIVSSSGDMYWDIGSTASLGLDDTAGELTIAAGIRTGGTVGTGNKTIVNFTEASPTASIIGLESNKFNGLVNAKLSGHASSTWDESFTGSANLDATNTDYQVMAEFNDTAQEYWVNNTSDVTGTGVDYTAAGDDGEWQRMYVGESGAFVVSYFVIWNRVLTTDEKSDFQTDPFAMIREAAGGGATPKNAFGQALNGPFGGPIGA